MLTSLYIKNVAVVKEINIDLKGGFSALTGETGAGKSVIIDSIGILLGSRSAKDKIRNGESEATVCGCFEELSEDTLHELSELGFDGREGITLQRTISADGKSSVRINGRAATQGMGKEIGRLLMTIHGQNDNQRLMQKAEHLGILDSYADTCAEKKEYLELFGEYRSLRERLESIKKSSAERIRLYDVYSFQAKEIDDAKIKIGEEEALLAEEKRLENIEKIEKHSQFVYHLLRGSEKSAEVLIEKASASLEQLSRVIDGASELAERLTQIGYEIEDIATAARDYAEGGGENAEKRLDRIESRLDSIQKLKRKYGVSEGEILAFRAELAEKLDEMENSDELLEKTQAELKRVMNALLSAGKALSDKRARAAKELEKLIMSELSFLEMPKVRFVIDINKQDEPRADGLDSVEFLVSANAGQPPMPMIKIASGGELSRIMLAIKSILLDKDGATSVIFDEIDTGISGKTSRKVGIKLKQIAKKIQVICVTHSAQIASLADNHFLISKSEIDGSAQTQVSLLGGEQSVSEVARILGGLNVTASQISAAREMIEEAKTL